MEHDIEEKIISIVKQDVKKFGNCSIRQAAHSIFYNSISMSEQKKLAKKIVKGNPLVSEIKNGEIIVKHNLNYSGTMENSEEDYTLIKSVAVIIIAILSYVLFKVFLPNLNN